MEESIQKLLNSLAKKDSIPLKVETTNSEYTMRFENEIKLRDGKDYKIGLLWFETTNSIYNIDSTNNTLNYYNGENWRYSKLPNGAYEISQINAKIQEKLQENGDDPNSIVLGIDVPTLKSTITLTNNYKIDFTVLGTFNSMLGFTDTVIETQGKTYSDKHANVTRTATVNMECSIVSGFYVNGKVSNLLFSAPIPVPTGYNFRVTPKNIIYLPIKIKSFNEITFRIVDENGNLINFNGYPIHYVVIIEQI